MLLVLDTDVLPARTVVYTSGRPFGSESVPMTNALLWVRNDARLDDNPALDGAIGSLSAGGRLTVLFVLDPRLVDHVAPPRRALLIAGLRDLDASLTEFGGRLLVRHGDPAVLVPETAATIGAPDVWVNRSITPFGRSRDQQVQRAIPLRTMDGTTTVPPDQIRTGGNTPYRVFTPYWRSWTDHTTPPTLHPSVDGRIAANHGDGVPDSDTEAPMAGGESAARGRLASFADVIDSGYTEMRDDVTGGVASGLSVDLKYGWLGPRRVLDVVGVGTDDRDAFRRQVAWRDFYAQVMYEWPETLEQPFQPKFSSLQWLDDPGDIEAWKTGATGFPIVDAAMRQLVATGRLHNRLRMVAASFLTKDLLVDWRIGERFFRHHLLDGDTAQNVGNWQWVAGTGADAAPYFRVFNPTTQSRRWDPTGAYIRRWVPELRSLSDRTIHEPSSSSPEELADAGVRLGLDYPAPIIDHGWARDRALAAYGRI